MDLRAQVDGETGRHLVIQESFNRRGGVQRDRCERSSHARERRVTLCGALRATVGRNRVAHVTQPRRRYIRALHVFTLPLP